MIYTSEPDMSSGERKEPVEAMFDAGPAGEVQEAINGLFCRFVSSDGLIVDYKGLRASRELKEYEQTVRRLADLDPLAPEPREERLAFWINLYNMSVLQAVGMLEGDSAVKDMKDFHERKVCNHGGRDYSLNDIEYGILRGNSRQPNRVWSRWRSWDARLKVAVQPPEPRVCFALARAPGPGPAIRFFKASQIEGQLYQAAVAFINNGGVIIDREGDTLSLSRLFRNYSADFGGGQGVIRFIADHLESDDAALVRSHAGRFRIKYHDLNPEPRHGV